MRKHESDILERMYLAAKALSNSCNDSYGLDIDGNNVCECNYSNKAKVVLDEVLQEYEQRSLKKRNSRSKIKIMPIVGIHNNDCKLIVKDSDIQNVDCNDEIRILHDSNNHCIILTANQAHVNVG